MSLIGKLFVFEGPDGCGKSTLSRIFSDKLRAIGEKCQWFAFPGREAGTLGKHVYEIHHNRFPSKIKRIHPASIQLLHIAAHIDAIERSIIPALQAGSHVVLDRYWWSTLVYGAISGVASDSLRAMVNVELLHWKQIRPAHLFLIQRKTPLVQNPTLQRISLAREYESLAVREADKYPVSRICNEGTILEALDAVLEAAKISQIWDVSPSRAISTKERKAAHAVLRDTAEIVSAPFLIHSKLEPAKPTVAYDTYWRFAAERQAIFFRRLSGQPSPWTEDPILQEQKFTNTYRASDRTSQYLIRNVIYSGDDSAEEVVFRILIFKVFNRIQSWELLTRSIGEISYRGFSLAAYDRVLNDAMSRGERIYSAAYIMPTGGPNSAKGRKHKMHLRLIEKMLGGDLPARLAEASSMMKAFEMLRSYPTIGDFLAYQYVTDLNYSTVLNFSEMDFVVPGPGARDGIRKCFADLGGLNEAEIIRWMAEHQEEEFDRLGLKFRSLWGRPLQLIDCQSLFCEVGKYCRLAHPEISGTTGRTRIKQKFQPSNEVINHYYPPKWHLNEVMVEEDAYVSSL
jgi:thymidylate kinase